MTQPENKAEALKPCPHCGAKAWLRDGATGRTRIECDDCQTGQLHFADHTEAVAAWNRRASLTEAPAVPVGVLPEGTLAMHGNDITIAYSCREDAERAFDLLETAMAPAGGEAFTMVQETKQILDSAIDSLIDLTLTLLSSPPVKAAAVDGPEEIEIDRLRLAAFKTNSNEDKAAYYLAVSKWFQDRHYRNMDAARAALASQAAVEPLRFENCTCHDEASKRLCMKKDRCVVIEAHSASQAAVEGAVVANIVGRAASVICEVGALCGWPGPECKSEEAAQALFDAGLLASPRPSAPASGAEGSAAGVFGVYSKPAANDARR
jgi:hypothetical protein